MVKVNIFEYADFRKFLADFQLAQQAVNPQYTKSYLCSILGMPNTRSYFTNLINGLELTKTFVERFLRILELTREEGQYFRVLVQFNQAETLEERELFFEQLISLNQTPKKKIDQEALTLYKKWYYSAVRAALDVYDLSTNYAELGKQMCPVLKPQEVKESINVLKELGLIRENEKGYYKPTDKSITVGSYIKEELVKQYQLQCIEMAKKAVLLNYGQPKNISTISISMSEDTMRRIEKKIQKFKSDIRSMVHKDTNPADRVYLLNLQFFPQARSKVK